MADRRKDDVKPYTRFRTSRFIQENRGWYFLTREGTQEGPFERRIDAEHRLEDYIKVMLSDLLPSDSNLSIDPI